MVCLHPVIQRPGRTSQHVQGLVYNLLGHTYLEPESTQSEVFEHQAQNDPDASFFDWAQELHEDKDEHESGRIAPECTNTSGSDAMRTPTP